MYVFLDTKGSSLLVIVHPREQDVHLSYAIAKIIDARPKTTRTLRHWIQ